MNEESSPYPSTMLETRVAHTSSGVHTALRQASNFRDAILAGFIYPVRANSRRSLV
jgi:hypothetical protein